MKNILVIGAGMSSPAFIRHALKQSGQQGWFLTIADIDPAKAEKRTSNAPNARGVWLDVLKSNDRKELISRSDIIVSILPAHLHLEIAHDCIKLNKPLLTASSISEEMYRLGDEGRIRELSYTDEMVLDPGLERMTLYKSLDTLKDKGAKIKSIRSFCGGTVTHSSKNPWNYKLTWNPRNVVLAGQGTAQFIENGKLRFIPYAQLFRKPGSVDIPEVGTFEFFPNRDTLLGMNSAIRKDVPNILRGTLRQPGFCKAWDALIQLGMTDGDFPILDAGKMSYYQLIDGIVSDMPGASLKDRVAQWLEISPDSEVIDKLKWLGLFSKKKIKLPNATPALILEQLIREKWKMEEKEKDLVIVHHEIDYTIQGKAFRHYSTCTVSGEDSAYTGMAKFIGLPIAILLQLKSQGKITNGVDVNQDPIVYNTVLEELALLGFSFKQLDETL